MPRKPTQAEQQAGDETTALVQLNRYLGKRKRVTIGITRNGDCACVTLDGGKTEHTEADLRHAVNAALAAELLK